MASGTTDRGQGPAYVYLIGHALLVIGFIFFTAGFATDHWLSTDAGRYGLWKLCSSQTCVTDSSHFPNWMLVTRLMQTLALTCYLLGGLVALFLHCTAQHLHQHADQHLHPPRGRPRDRVLEVFATLGSVLCLAGVSVYGKEGSSGEGRNSLQYSFALSAFSLVLTAPGTVMVAMTRRAVTSGNHAAVTPQPYPINDANNVFGSYPPQPPHPFHQQPAVGGSAGYAASYGNGSHNGYFYYPPPYRLSASDEQPANSGYSGNGAGGIGYDVGLNGGGAGEGGGCSTGQPASDSLGRELPSGRPGNQGQQHGGGPAVTRDSGHSDLPGGGFGPGGGGGGRLPPINPSAPPPPPDHDMPPSYDEAVSQRVT